MLAPRPGIDSLLASRHVCVVGATENSFAGTIAQRILRRHGFDGLITQVHPRNRIVDGAPCAPSLADLDAVPDVAVLLAPAAALPGVLTEAEAVGVAVDRQLGQRATLGVGGALTEQAGLAVCDLAPRTRDDALVLLRRTVGSQVDAAFAAPWVDAVCAVLVGLSAALRAGEASEIEINPLAVDRLGGRAVAIDVLARGGPEP